MKECITGMHLDEGEEGRAAAAHDASRCHGFKEHNTFAVVKNRLPGAGPAPKKLEKLEFPPVDSTTVPTGPQMYWVHSGLLS